MATVYQYFDPGAAQPHSTNIPEAVVINGTNFPVWGWAFADSTQDDQKSYRWRAIEYGSGNVTVDIDWYSRSGSTSGAVVWGAALSVLTPGDATSMEADAFATENTQTTTVNGTAKGLTRTSITVSNLDSLAAEDSVEMRITRRQSNGSDTMTGDAIIVGITVSYSDT